MSLTTLLIIVLVVLLLGGGGWGYSRYGAMGMSPVAVLLLVLLVLWVTGNLNV